MERSTIRDLAAPNLQWRPGARDKADPGLRFAPSGLRVAARQFAGAGAGIGPGRGLSTVPSDLVTETQAPAGRPSRSGRVRTVTWSPGRSAFALIPARISALGPSASMPHKVSLPLSSRTTT